MGVTEAGPQGLLFQPILIRRPLVSNPEIEALLP